MVLENCEPELSYVLAELFSMLNSSVCLKESCFLDCWKVLSVVPVLKNIGERSTGKTYPPVSLLPTVSKVIEKLLNIIGLLITWRNLAVFLISSMVLGLLDQLRIF